MNFKKSVVNTVAAAALATAGSSAFAAADEVNVAFFLEWATPNMVAKVQKDYEDAMGVPVNWTNFDAGTQMTEAMLAGDIDISYSQGLAPFIGAVNANAPIQMVAIAVTYPANECVVGNNEGIDKNNASELEGKTVAVPLGTMADYSFRMQMRALDVDLEKINVVDQIPPDGAIALAEGSVAMACVFGGDSLAKAREFGKDLMTAEESAAAGVISFDVVSVTEKFAQENPDLVRSFLEVTDEANTSHTASEEELKAISMESGMDVDGVIQQMATMSFPSHKDQLENYFNEDGIASAAIGVVGNAFATPENPARDDYSVVIDTSFIE